MAFGMFRLFSTAAVLRAKSLNEYGMIGFDDRPYPIWSGMMTRKPSLRRASAMLPK